MINNRLNVFPGRFWLNSLYRPVLKPNPNNITSGSFCGSRDGLSGYKKELKDIMKDSDNKQPQEALSSKAFRTADWKPIANTAWLFHATIRLVFKTPCISHVFL